MDSNDRSDSLSSSEHDPKVPLAVLPLHSSNLLTVLDGTGIIQYESPSIEVIYGFGQDELVGEQVADYFHPEDRDEVTAAFRAVVARDTEVEAVEYRHQRADGTYVWVESVASANPTPDGNYVVNTRDISDRKEREHHLEATNERLEEFASVVSHDLRNPLNVAQARIQLAQQESHSDHLEAVATAHDRMETLISDLLTLSRVGRRVSEMEPVSLARLSTTCWETVPTSDATLVTDTDSYLQADRNRLRQLLENLIRNAVDHAGEGVTVTVGETDAGFYVEDDGPGIPPHERADVFEAGTSSTADGTGLGLSIATQIADAHEWVMAVTDGPEGGARFEITNVEFSQK